MADGLDPQGPTVGETVESVASDHRRWLSGATIGLEAALLLLVLGLAIGATMSTFGLELFSTYAPVMFSTLLAIVVALAALFTILIVFRRVLWARVFQRADLELQRIAQPMARVATRAADKDVQGAADAARDLAEHMLARYAWLSTRRWVIATLTGLIAAIAALAGSALLFRQTTLLDEQNRTLKAQSVLLGDQTELLTTQTNRMTDQNKLIEQQSVLLRTQTQLAEAERNSQIGEYVIDVGARVSDDRQAWLEAGRSMDDFGLAALKAGTRGRIVAATLVARPYRYLAPDLPDARDQSAVGRFMLGAAIDFVERGRAADAPVNAGLERMQARLREIGGRVRPAGGGVRLIERPISPERGDILSILVGNGVTDTDFLTFQGADFSFAEYRREVLPGINLRHARLRYAVFDHTQIQRSDFAGARLDAARFRSADIEGTRFSGLSAEEVQPPFADGSSTPHPTQLTGADFRRASLHATRFDEALASAMDMREAGLARVSFRGAQLGGTNFAGAILSDIDFAGADMASVDLSDALVFDKAFLDRIAQGAPERWVAERWMIEPASLDEYRNHPVWARITNYIDDEAIGTSGAFHIRRVPGK